MSARLTMTSVSARRAAAKGGAGWQKNYESGVRDADCCLRVYVRANICTQATWAILSWRGDEFGARIPPMLNARNFC